MKKIFLIPAGLVLALGFQSCQNNNTADAGREQHNMDSTVNARIMTLRDSMLVECNRMVMSAAQAHADSVLALASGTPRTSTGRKPTTTPATTPTTAPSDPKGNKMSGNDASQEKKDKMENNQGTNADKKADKMNRPK